MRVYQTLAVAVIVSGALSACATHDILVNTQSTAGGSSFARMQLTHERCQEISGDERANVIFDVKAGNYRSICRVQVNENGHCEVRAEARYDDDGAGWLSAGWGSESRMPHTPQYSTTCRISD